MISPRRFLLEVLMPLTKEMGLWHLSPSRRHFSAADWRELSRNAQPGDVVLSRTRGSFTNMLIPGFWKHVGLVVDFGMVIESTGSGVVAKDLLDFGMGKDYVALMRPKFCDKQTCMAAAGRAVAVVGRPYDYLFDPDASAFYCAELIAYAYESIVGSQVVARRDTMGTTIVLPEDFSNAPSHWENVWASSHVAQSHGKIAAQSLTQQERITQC